MDVLRMFASRRRSRGPGLATVALAVTVLTAPVHTVTRSQAAPDVSVKAAFIYNFAKFTEWPAMSAGAPIILCVAGDDDIASALVQTVSGRDIDGHALEVRRPEASSTWRACSVLFITSAEIRRSGARLAEARPLPVLTVSDHDGFARAGGLIELYVESGRMRFAINVDAVKRSGLRLSSRLLGLARIVRD